jgi:hypothetical protein
VKGRRAVFFISPPDDLADLAPGLCNQTLSQIRRNTISALYECAILELRGVIKRPREKLKSADKKAAKKMRLLDDRPFY